MPSARFGAAQADCWMRFLVGVIIVIVASRQVIVRLAVGSPDTTDLIYKHVILLPNYFEHGFVRRGLDGTIYALISDRHFFESLYVFHVFAAVWLAMPVTLLLETDPAWDFDVGLVRFCADYFAAIITSLVDRHWPRRYVNRRSTRLVHIDRTKS